MDPDEIEFKGENEMVRIVPNFNQSAIHFIAGDVGPFKAGRPVYVPLWMAVNLKQQHKCTILPPSWFDVDFLEELRENEKNNRYFTPMPNEYYMIIAKLLLKHAVSDIPRANELKIVLKDIWDIRMAKLRSSIDNFVKSDGALAKLNFLTVMEINSCQPLLPDVLQQLDRMEETQNAALQERMNDSSLSADTSLFTNDTPLLF